MNTTDYMQIASRLSEELNFKDLLLIQLSKTITKLELENKELKHLNCDLSKTIKKLELENKELELENHILKKEVEYYHSLIPKYDYKEMKQTKKNLHNEYKRIYKLIKKNIGFNLC